MKAFVATIIALILCSSLVFTSSMANNIAPLPPQPEKEQLPEKVDERLTTATSKFAFKLYEQVLKQRSGQNVFISPMSVMLALAMTYNGAEGQTRQAMAKALELEGMES